MGSHAIAPRPKAARATAHAKEGEVRAVLDALRRIVHGLRSASSTAERRFGLSGAQLFVLVRLRGEQALSINELAARTLTHQSSVSVVVARLVARGLVSRTRGVRDARRVELKLTRRGLAVLRRAPEATQERLIAAIEALTATERQRLAATLARLGRSVTTDTRAPRMLFEEDD